MAGRKDEDLGYAVPSPSAAGGTFGVWAGFKLDVVKFDFASNGAGFVHVAKARSSTCERHTYMKSY